MAKSKYRHGNIKGRKNLAHDKKRKDKLKADRKQKKADKEKADQQKNADEMKKASMGHGSGTPMPTISTVGNLLLSSNNPQPPQKKKKSKTRRILKTLGIVAVAALAGYAIAKRVDRPSKRMRRCTSDPSTMTDPGDETDPDDTTEPPSPIGPPGPAAGETNNYMVNLTIIQPGGYTDDTTGPITTSGTQFGTTTHVVHPITTTTMR